MSAGWRSLIIQSPTGSGKTLLTAHMVKTAASKGMDCWFTVHRRELVNQSVRAFSEVGIDFGIVAAGSPPSPKAHVQICSIQTLAKRFHKLKPPSLIIFDEAHHIAAGSWSKIKTEFPEAFCIGLTATPSRLDGRGLGTWFHKMVKGPSVASLIEAGFLSPYRLFAPPTVNMAGVPSRMGDYAKPEMEMRVNKPTITGDAIREYQTRAQGKRAVVFCVSIKHSIHVVEQFRNAGFRAEHVDGETPPEDRDAAIRRFQSGTTQVLSNVELFGEGFDLPAIECAVLLRPTQSLGLYLQQVGRALRPSPGKTEAIILDHVGNCERHGLPDQEREWSLAGNQHKRVRKSDEGPAVCICKVCYAAYHPKLEECPCCGCLRPVKPRQVGWADGELVEVTKDVLEAERHRYIRQREQGDAQTEEDLIKIGRMRGYKRPHLWARHIMMARRRKGRTA